MIITTERLVDNDEIRATPHSTLIQHQAERRFDSQTCFVLTNAGAAHAVRVLQGNPLVEPPWNWNLGTDAPASYV